MENQSHGIIGASDPKNFRKAICGRCGYMLAIRGNNEVSIKSGELYFYFYSGMLSVVCRGCAANNLIIDEEFDRLHKDKVESHLARVNVIRAEYEPWKSRKEKESEKHNSFQKPVTLTTAGESKNV